MMHWEQHPAGWTAWQDQPFMNPSFDVTKINGRWVGKSTEPATMTKPALIEIHQITQKLTPADREQLAAEAAKTGDLRQLSRQETRVLGTYDATNYVLSNFKHFKITLTDVGVRIDNYYNMNGAAQGPVSFTYGDLEDINTWYGNTLVSLKGPRESYSLSFHDGTGNEFVRMIQQARNDWKQKYKSLEDSDVLRR
jgi:hypothetical protein